MKKLIFTLAISIILIAGFVNSGICGACNLRAYPETPLEAMYFSPYVVSHQVARPDPADVVVTVGAADGVMITPTIQVVPSDVGTSGYLLMYIYVPASNYGVNIPGKQTTLGTNQLITLLPNPINFSNAAGLSFIVYFGYARAGGEILYNVYTVNVVECGNNASPPCGVEQTQELCETIKGCVWQSFPSAGCVVDCSPYSADEQTCNSAFDGNTCQWVQTPFANTCGPK